jgi:hypothetical protein
VKPAATAGVLAVLASLGAAPAHAHFVETGFGRFYDGLAHVVLTPSDALVVVAVALLAGQRGTRAARYGLFALTLAWIVGAIIGAAWPVVGALPLLTTLSFAAAGALVALDAKVGDAGVAALSVGLRHGFLNGAAMLPRGANVLALGGVITAVFCLTAMLSAQVTALPAGWRRLAVRVAGSWIAGAGLLMLGWLARSAT